MSQLPSNEKGTVLAISLIILLLISLIGITGVQVTSLEEKMAGNTKDLNLAFQAAEFGLREGESFVRAQTGSTVFAGSGGLLGEVNDEPDFSNPENWTDDNSNQVDSDFGPDGVSEQPRYIIKLIGQTDLNNNQEGNLGNIGSDTSSGGELVNFRITAKGTGSNSGSVVLQSYYVWQF